MAKRHPKRKFNLRKVRYDSANVLTTLANRIVQSDGLTGTSANLYRVMSVKCTWTLKGLTAGEGPLVFGFNHSDYSVTEIKECIEAQAAIDQGDKVAQEQANRLVRIVGSFSGSASNEKFNDGRPMKTRLNWSIGIGDAVNMFTYNDSGATLTTGAIVDTNGVLWVKP